MEDTFKERMLNKTINPISIEKTKKILFQMKRCICKIYINGIKGTGFFTKIPYNKDFIKVLITDNHIINENNISNQNTITISLNNEKIKKDICIDAKRKYYTSKELDTTIIEISEKDEIYDFLEIKDELLVNLRLDNNKNYKNLYINSSIYILHYFKNEQV